MLIVYFNILLINSVYIGAFTKRPEKITDYYDNATTNQDNESKSNIQVEKSCNLHIQCKRKLKFQNSLISPFVLPKILGLPYKYSSVRHLTRKSSLLE
jgi:hypothetical protein